jgi:mannitol-1-phosphate 5-dehydrogenase
MRFLVWGAGKIGRGFIADIMREGGQFVDFVDLNGALVDALNARGRYSIYKADESGIRTETVEGGFEAHRVSDDLTALFLEGDVCVDVAVFKNDLAAAADAIAPYVALRAEKMPGSFLNFIINVNMTSPEHAFRHMLEERLSGAARRYLDRNVGVSGIFMMCISPDAKPEMIARDPLAVYNNGFYEQAVARDAFRGSPPRAPRLRLSDWLEAEEARKLYTLNMAHCAAAYLGMPAGHETSYQAIRDPGIEKVIVQALDEAAIGLSGEYGFTQPEMRGWGEVILSLLRNPHMVDPLWRLGADTRRKLACADRLVTPARLCLAHGGVPKALSKIIRAGYDFKNDDPGTNHVRALVEAAGLRAAVRAVSGLNEGDTLYHMIIEEE